MAKFKIGDLARIIFCEPGSSEDFIRRKNEIVEIDEYSPIGFIGEAPHLIYGVTVLVDGEEFYCSEQELGPIGLPKSDREIDKVVSWEDVGWAPKILEPS